MKFRIYVLCYDENSRNSANNEFKDKEWAKVVFIKTTVLFENIMYDSWLIDNYEEWKDLDYIGTISWKASQKIPLPNINKVVDYMYNNNYGISVFYTIPINMIERTNYLHPKFKSLWTKILLTAGFTNEMILETNFIGFYCNYWITTPKLMLEYISFFKDIKKIIDNLEDIQDDIWSDAGFKSTTLISKDRCMRIFNKPYYPYHPFIYERLPNFFFYFKTNILITNTISELYS